MYFTLTKVHIEKEDEESGIVLIPSEQTVTVKHSVVTDIKFSQFVTTLRGSVNCLGKESIYGYINLLVCAVDCPPMEVRLQRIVHEILLENQLS